MLENIKSKIFQIYYKESCIPHLDTGFVPFNHIDSLGVHWENEPIRYYYEYGILTDCDYIGFLSWRFKEKTGLTSKEVFNAINGKHDVYSFSPEIYYMLKHPFCKEGYKGVNSICRALDETDILPLKITLYDKQPLFCNYWVAKTDIYADYCKNWLIPCMNFINSRPDLLKLTEMHRGQETIASVFFLEGLFSVYLDYKGIEYKWITKGVIMDKISKNHWLLNPIYRQMEYLKEKGVSPKVVLMSENYKQQLMDEVPQIFCEHTTGVHKQALFINGCEMGLYINPIEDNYVKVCGD